MAVDEAIGAVDEMTICGDYTTAAAAAPRSLKPAVSRRTRPLLLARLASPTYEHRTSRPFGAQLRGTGLGHEYPARRGHGYSGREDSAGPPPR